MIKFLITLIFVPFCVFAGNGDVGKLLSLIPSNKVGTPIYFANPMEPQIYLGHNNIQSNTYMPFQGMVPFGIGGKKQLYKKHNYEIGFSTVVHGQLGYREENGPSLKGTRISLLNTDFLLNFYYTRRIKKHWKVKIETFHRSTHLGDDLVLLNGITAINYWNIDESSYEELNILLNRSLLFNTINLYSSVGYNYRKDSPREKWTVNFGGQFDAAIIPVLRRFVLGFDIRWLENNNWNTAVNKSIGFKLNKKGSVKLMVHHYSGNISYSRYESILTQSYWRFGIYFDSILK
jgi:hypothetical protein|tara:strand:+ start:5685 stop:6554 length:870 start_codon:yes stop_codon:yes gene_type:complete